MIVKRSCGWELFHYGKPQYIINELSGSNILTGEFVIMKSSEHYPCIIFIIVIVSMLSGYTATSWAVRQIHPHVIMPVVGPPPEYRPPKSFYKWKSNDIVKAFNDNGLEVVTIESGMVIGAPGAKESTIFRIPSFGDNVGSLVSSFGSLESINESVEYYSKMNESADSPVWWIFKKDNVLVLISGKVPKERAGQYDRVLSNMDDK
jgi:hypothetical protein